VSFKPYPKYKESGVEWLGRVPEHWEVCKLQHLFEIHKRIAGQLGYDVFSITQNGIRVKDVESNEGQQAMDYSTYQLVQEGEFAMNPMDLITGGVDIAAYTGVTSPDYRVCSMRRAEDHHKRFFLYLVQNAYRRKLFYPYGQGSSQLGRWRFPRQQFNAFCFPVPSRLEQAAVATFLDHETAKIDALIAEQQRLIELLQEKRQAVISHAVTKGLNPDAPMKDSGIEWLGEVPEHWEVCPLKTVVSRIEQGWSPQCENRPAEDGEWGVLKVGCVNGERFNPEEQKALPGDVAPLAEYEVAEGDILLSRGNTRELVGMAALVPAVRSKLLLSDLLYRVRARPEAASAEFLVHLLRSRTGRFQIERSATGTSASMKKVSQGVLQNVMVAIPPMAEQSDILLAVNQSADRLDTLASEAYSAITLLQERRSALISAAVTGQIDVRGFSATGGSEAA
jgi:type I restriction enzyme S subunit